MASRMRSSMPESAPSTARLRTLASVERAIGHRFRDKGLLDLALSHASLANEGRPSYERLEFLGDAVLGMLVAEHLYRSTPEIPEGQLTDRRARIVSREPLAAIGRQLGLASHLAGGRGMREQDRQSPRILADLVEAVLGAIYVDAGIRAARGFVQRHVLQSDEALAADGAALRDPKSRLLQLAQARGLGQPDYRLIAQEGPEHERMFRIAVVMQRRRVAVGTGRSKQLAEKDAAAAALLKLSKTPAPPA